MEDAIDRIEGLQLAITSHHTGLFRNSRETQADHKKPQKGCYFFKK